MKTLPPKKLVREIEIRQRRPKGDFEKGYRQRRRLIDESPGLNLPTKRLRFVHTRKPSTFNMSGLRFK